MARRKRVGEVRPSQVMHTFGIGALIDLPHFSAMAMGLESWDMPTLDTTIAEDRLLNLVRSHLGPQVDLLVRPPAKTDTGQKINPFEPEYTQGVPVAPFPRWLRCPICNRIAPMNSGVFELKHNAYKPDQTRYIHQNCQFAKNQRGPTALPVRFVRVCEHGHLDDFPWVEFVHGGPTKCKSRLKLYEFGVSAEAADIAVKCDECSASIKMTTAFGEKGQEKLGPCTGGHYHLRHNEECKEPAKAMLNGASNIWFAVNVSVLTIPGNVGKLERLIKDNWPTLNEITSMEVLSFARKTSPNLKSFAEWSDEQIWDAIETERSGMRQEEIKIGMAEMKAEEWDIFSQANAMEDTQTLKMKVASPPAGYKGLIEEVVLVERLREVSAMIGFTRIVSPGDFADLDELDDLRRVPISRSAPKWVPSAEVFGEGVFIRLNEKAIDEWSSRPVFKQLEQEFYEAHTNFRTARRIAEPSANFPGMKYVLLHSISHMLIRQFAIECGYGAASIRERIYAADGSLHGGPMAGILLYTAAPDSEGTLGGLVGLGKPDTLVRHLDHALGDMQLCASDPLCSEHVPTDDTLGLHGASCHACLFAAETSCERSNKYLDRRLLVETMGDNSLAFFDTGKISG